MGGNICNNCHGYCQKEEQDMSESLVNQQNNEYTKLFKNSRATFQTTVKMPETSVNNESINKSIAKNKEIEVESKLKILIKAFRKLKIMKDKAHKIITLRENLKENRNLIIAEGDESLNVDLFPELNYNYLGNIFQEKEDGFGIQYFPKNNAKYVGYFRNGKRIDFCLFEDKSKFYTYKGLTKK